MNDKETLRAEMRRIRASLGKRRERSRSICLNAFRLVESSGESRVLSYLSYGSEADTAPINRMIAQSGRELYLPRCVSENEFIAVRWRPGDPLEKGIFGIDEPAGGEEGECGIALIPLLAFDGNMYRLGQGKGCYDRYLRSRNIIRIGLAFNRQRAETVFPAPHDIPMDYIVTESGVYTAKLPDARKTELE